MEVLKQDRMGTKKYMEQLLRYQARVLECLRQAKVDNKLELTSDSASPASTPCDFDGPSKWWRNMNDSMDVLAGGLPDGGERKWPQGRGGDSMLFAMGQLQDEMSQEVAELRRAMAVQAAAVQRLASVSEAPKGRCGRRLQFIVAFLLGLVVAWLAGRQGAHRRNFVEPASVVGPQRGGSMLLHVSQAPAAIHSIPHITSKLQPVLREALRKSSFMDVPVG